MTVEQTLPHLIAPVDRAREAASIIADAIARLHATKPAASTSDLGFSATERVHSNPSTPGVSE
jgi:hypothetical protein